MISRFLPTPDRPAPGIRRKGDGWEAFVRVRRLRGISEFRSKRFPRSTDLSKMIGWIAEQRARALLRLPAHDGAAAPAGHSFSDDVDRYLKSVPNMPSFKDRRRHLLDWARELDPQRARGRADITPLEIKTVLERWATQGFTRTRVIEIDQIDGTTKRVTRKDHRTYADGSINRRRTALMSFYAALDGKSAANPVRDVARRAEDEAPLDLPEFDDALKAIEAVVQGQRGRKTAARLRVFLWTGWPPAQIRRLTPERLQREIAAAKDSQTLATITVARRRKGKGTKTAAIPVLSQAVDALRTFDDERAYGTFSTSSMRHSLARACQRVHVRPFHPYALRHLFLVRVAELTDDPLAVHVLAQHTDMKQTMRYIRTAAARRAIAALTAVQAKIGGRKVG